MEHKPRVLNLQPVQALLVERHHAPGDGHVHGDLRRHAADQDHLFSGVGMEGRVEHILGPPQLILGQARGDDSFSAGRENQLVSFQRLIRLPLLLQRRGGWS